MAGHPCRKPTGVGGCLVIRVLIKRRRKIDICGRERENDIRYPPDKRIIKSQPRIGISPEFDLRESQNRGASLAFGSAHSSVSRICIARFAGSAVRQDNHMNWESGLAVKSQRSARPKHLIIRMRRKNHG